jgi:hypothetical protein
LPVKLRISVHPYLFDLRPELPTASQADAGRAAARENLMSASVELLTTANQFDLISHPMADPWSSDAPHLALELLPGSSPDSDPATRPPRAPCCTRPVRLRPRPPSGSSAPLEDALAEWPWPRSSPPSRLGVGDAVPTVRRASWLTLRVDAVSAPPSACCTSISLRLTAVSISMVLIFF